MTCPTLPVAISNYKCSYRTPGKNVNGLIYTNHNKHRSLWFVRTSDAIDALQFVVAYLRCFSHHVHGICEECFIRVCNDLGYSSLVIIFLGALITTILTDVFCSIWVVFTRFLGANLNNCCRIHWDTAVDYDRSKNLYIGETSSLEIRKYME